MRRQLVIAIIAGAIGLAYLVGYSALFAHQLGEGVTNVTAANDRSVVKNAGFEDVGEAEKGYLPNLNGWLRADFWNNQQAAGVRTLVPGVGSNNALQLVLTDAPKEGYHFGVQQPCGEYTPGTWLTFSADLDVPAQLAGSSARAELIIYPPSLSIPHVSVHFDQYEPTNGWRNVNGSVRVPDQAKSYSCVVLLHLVTLHSLEHVADTAVFDNIIVALAQ